MDFSLRSPSPILTDPLDAFPAIDRPATPFVMENRCEPQPTSYEPMVSTVTRDLHDYFHLACETNDVQLLHEVLNKVPNPSWPELLNSVNIAGNIGLRTAVERGHERVVESLLRLSAYVDPYAQGQDGFSLIDIARQKGYDSILINLQDLAILNLTMSVIEKHNCIKEYEITRQLAEIERQNEQIVLRTQIKKLESRLKKLEMSGRHQSFRKSTKSLCSRMDWSYQLRQQQKRFSDQILQLEQDITRKDREIEKWQKKAQMYRKTNCQLPLHESEPVESDSFGLQVIFRRVQENALTNFQLSSEIFKSLQELTQQVHVTKVEQQVRICLKDLVDKVADV